MERTEWENADASVSRSHRVSVFNVSFMHNSTATHSLYFKLQQRAAAGAHSATRLRAARGFSFRVEDPYQDERQGGKA
jgi:hypothetical protein